MTATKAPAPPWSKSSLDEILHGCSWRWKLKKIDGLNDPGTPATAAGTAYHTAIEEYQRERIAHRLTGGLAGDATGIPFPVMEHAALLTLEHEWDQLDEATLARHESFDDSWVATVSALRNWWDEGLRDRIMDLVPISIEPYFREPYADSGLHGYIDEVAWDPERECWVVIDYKTAKDFGRWPHGGGGHEIEATVYVAGSSTAIHLPTWQAPVSMEWHIARKKQSDHARFEPTRIVEIELDQWHFDSLGDDVAAADRLVATGGYVKNPAWNLCSVKWCPFHVENDGPCDPNEL